MTRIADIREQISALPKDVEQAFTIINRVSKLIIQGGGNDNDVVDIVIRLRGQESLYKAFSEVLGEMISGLCRQVGLIPYISNDVKSFDYGFAREIYRNPVDPSFILHAEQAKVFNRLVRGEGLALSAPTSFGKSILIDALNDILLEYDDGRLDGVVEYSFFSTGLRNWFLPGVLKGLDEYGVPHPIIQKAESRLNHRDFDTAIAQLKALAGTDFFEPVENQILAICFEEQP
jgi:hypothetical protein